MRPGIDGIPAQFVDLCNLSILSTVQNNPYHAAIRMLCPLFSMKCTTETVMKYPNFIGYMRPEFIALLQRQDARALLILGCWYGLVCRCNQWWLARRRWWNALLFVSSWKRTRMPTYVSFWISLRRRLDTVAVSGRQRLTRSPSSYLAHAR